MSYTKRFRLKIVTILALLGLGCYGVYNAFSAQGVGELMQWPLNVDVQAKPAFIMAVDDSGSMTYHNQFPNVNGYGCWYNTGSSNTSGFFLSPGILRTSENTPTNRYARANCVYAYSYTGTRTYDDFFGIPPIDRFGFARSPDFNPAYFDPAVIYQPWLNAEGRPYDVSNAENGDASVTATKIHPANSAVGTINLASQLEDVNANSRFDVEQSMYLPEGTRYRLVGERCGSLTAYKWVTVAEGGVVVSAHCQVYISYWPATFYLRSKEVPEGYEAVDRVEVLDACGTGCNMFRYKIQSKDVAALQNFANWFSYYGTRTNAIIAGMTRSVAEVNKMYISYATINNYDNYDNPVGAVRERLAVYDMSSLSDRKELYAKMISLPADGSTPNRTAVLAALRQFEVDADSAPIKLACQKNAVMLFTDGYSNGDDIRGIGNIDSSMGPPFSDGYSNTMADIAAKYYVNNNGQPPLRTDLPSGGVPVPRTCPSNDPKVDCQSNLHVNFYGVTLGGRGILYDPDTEQDPYTDSAIYTQWPGSTDDDRNTIDDIWHAAINTRGEFISARSPVDIVDAMRRILSAVGGGSTSSGSIAFSGARISSGSFGVTPFYESTNDNTDWYGKLTAQSVATTSQGGVEYTDLWEASEKIPVASSRNIYFGSDGGVKPFNENNVTLTSLCDSTTSGMSSCSESEITDQLGVTLAQAVAYLRGDQELEGSASNPLRKRTTRLGDIVNSSPVISSSSDDYGFRSLYSVGANGANEYDKAGYASYLTSKKSTARSVVYVGANDGMLHAFDGLSGIEKFAFIPQSVLGHLGNLLYPHREEDELDQKFEHRYYVDGRMAVSDVAYSNGDWATVLVGASGAGGKGVFALDVTAATGFELLWEINGMNAHSDISNNIGYVLGEPVIVPVRTTTGVVSWKAIFGNGYNSNGRQAMLFVVDVKTGNVTLLPAAESSVTDSNGLGNVVVLDRWGGGICRHVRSMDMRIPSTRLIREGLFGNLICAELLPVMMV